MPVALLLPVHPVYDNHIHRDGPVGKAICCSEKIFLRRVPEPDHSALDNADASEQCLMLIITMTVFDSYRE